VIPLVIEEEVAWDFYFPLVRWKEIAQQAIDVVVEYERLNFPPKKRAGGTFRKKKDCPLSWNCAWGDFSGGLLAQYE